MKVYFQFLGPGNVANIVFVFDVIQMDFGVGGTATVLKTFNI